jgi:drug/metabolite transporter superfamily protein YnfA
MVSLVKTLRANRVAMTVRQSLLQLVVYGNRLAVAATSGRKRQLSANSGVWVLFWLRINTQFHIHKTYVTTRQ